MDGEHSSGSGMSRRDLLKRGAVVGAAAAWTIPVIQVVSMTPAGAATPSAPTVIDNPPPPAPEVKGSTETKGSTVVADSAPVKATGSDGLAFTGPGAPVGSTVAIGATAIALGAGAVAAAAAVGRRKSAEDAEENASA